MSENQNSPEQGGGQGQQTVIVVQGQSNLLGILSIVFSILSFFVLSILFAPLGIILGLVACFKKQAGLGILGIILAVVSMALSPTIWLAMFGMAAR